MTNNYTHTDKGYGNIELNKGGFITFNGKAYEIVDIVPTENGVSLELERVNIEPDKNGDYCGICGYEKTGGRALTKKK